MFNNELYDASLAWPNCCRKAHCWTLKSCSSANLGHRAKLRSSSLISSSNLTGTDCAQNLRTLWFSPQISQILQILWILCKNSKWWESQAGIFFYLSLMWGCAAGWLSINSFTASSQKSVCTQGLPLDYAKCTQKCYQPKFLCWKQIELNSNSGDSWWEEIKCHQIVFVPICF